MEHFKIEKSALLNRTQTLLQSHQYFQEFSIFKQSNITISFTIIHFIKEYEMLKI